MVGLIAKSFHLTLKELSLLLLQASIYMIYLKLRLMRKSQILMFLYHT